MRNIDRIMGDPFINNTVNGIVEDAELLGFDIDRPDELSGLISNVVKKIGARVRKRREAKAAKNTQSQFPSFNIQAGQGNLSYGPEGLSYVGPSQIPIGNTGMVLQTPQQQSPSILDTVKNNPVLLAIPAGLLIFAIMKKKGAKK